MLNSVSNLSICLYRWLQKTVSVHGAVKTEQLSLLQCHSSPNLHTRCHLIWFDIQFPYRSNMALGSKKGWKSIVPLHLKAKSAPRFCLFAKAKSANFGPGNTPVYLNVYDLTPMNGYVYWAGLGIFHSGVEVHGVEYAFGAHDYPSSGVFEVEPRQCPGFKFRKSIFIGTTCLDSTQVRDFMERQAASYNGDTYHLIVKNCNHFCKDICYKLTGKRIPKWVNRLAKLGSVFNCVLPEALKITAVQHDHKCQAYDDSEKRRLRSTFSCLSSISMRQRQLSTSSLFLQSPLKGCLPPWELRRSMSGSLKVREVFGMSRSVRPERNNFLTSKASKA
ncbi:unnamed protein product [Fraxinus pennsylvanica]|uniref:PPPDE domain-containing protein n=1 Tax=Fraxinus pennsylvanica TaxID=56036 RepID=A0AAD2DNK2_9LAMI|nr:unnamed protein product [Fraxinus pennsylvanica]